jgi:hypothetical protein
MILYQLIRPQSLVGTALFAALPLTNGDPEGKEFLPAESLPGIP